MQLLPDSLRLLIYSIQLFPEHPWSYSHGKTFLYMSAGFSISPQKHPPVMKHFWQVTVHESMVFSLSMEDKGTFGLTDPQVLQNRAIPLKSGEIHNLMLPLLMPRCSGDPTLSTALFLILCCPTSEALLCCFLNRKCSCLNPTFLLPEEIKKILNYMQNTLICLKFMPVPCYQQQFKVCGKEKALVEK